MAEKSIGVEKLGVNGWEKWRNAWNEARALVRTNAEKRGINLSEVKIIGVDSYGIAVGREV